MVKSLSRSLCVLAWCLMSALPSVAKSPEDFIGDEATPIAKTIPDPKPAPVKGAKPSAPLDTAKLHAIYLDGDFDQAIRVMEGALKNKKVHLSHTDSVFIFKHLGVMYAAAPATREKGRYYMAQLISVEPTAKILDMYASDMIYFIFRNVLEEFENKNGKATKRELVAPTPTPVPQPLASTGPVDPPKKSASNTGYWITGGAVAAVGIAGLLYILLNDPQPQKHNIVLQE